MAENLWELRERRGLSMQALANEAGVPLLSILEYEQGHPVRAADRERLAQALSVDETEIKLESEPKPKKEKKQKKKPRPGRAPKKTAKPKPPKPKKEPPPPPPARPTQIKHLLDLAAILNQNEAEVAEEAGKPLDDLTQKEATDLLRDYTERVKEIRDAEEAERPPGTRRKRAHLPEGVDQFEMDYLEARQEAGDRVTFKLLTGKTVSGRVVGFSPYQIAIEREDGTEMMLQKMALAYYSVEEAS